MKENVDIRVITWVRVPAYETKDTIYARGFKREIERVKEYGINEWR